MAFEQCAFACTTPMNDSTNHGELLQRLQNELIDSFDEELEVEFEDRSQFGLDIDGPKAEAQRAERRAYFRQLFRLQGELVKLQDWVVATRQKVVVVFEGRDAAGKGGVIKRITQRLNPRVCRVVALPAPNDRERTQWYFQRYAPHLPAGGEIVLFDRSWYNRAGVERVMGFCTDEEASWFLRVVPEVEFSMTRSGIVLLKYWLEVSPEEQERRLRARMEDGRKTWKLSPMDVKSYDRWDDYTRARDEMFAATDKEWAPWHVARSEDKKRVRLNVIRHLLDQIPYKKVDAEKISLPKRKVGRYQAADHPFKFIPERY
jgi:polyphosphate kinase 2